MAPRAAMSRPCWNIVGSTCRSGVTAALLTPLAFRSMITRCLRPVAVIFVMVPSGADATGEFRNLSASTLFRNRSAYPASTCFCTMVWPGGSAHP